MYDSFRVNNFKCFNVLELEGLKRVNLIAGKNNSGKTAILEALFLHAGANGLTLRINIFRGFEFVELDFKNDAISPWDSLFPNFDHTNEIILDATFNDMNYRSSF